MRRLAGYCKELKAYEDEIADLEEKIKYKKEKADKISSEIIPNMLAEQGLSSLKLADGSADVSKKSSLHHQKRRCGISLQWLRENGLDDIIKNEVFVTFGKGEDNKAKDLLDLAELNRVMSHNKNQKVEPMTLMALYRERVEAGLDMPSDSFNLFVKDETKISRKK